MTNSPNFFAYQERLVSLIDHYLPEAPGNRLVEAMRYALKAGGKRLRPLMTYLTGEALSVPLEMLDHCAFAMECLHTYSLIHDDLPAMDNANLRRGKPSCHLAFDEATAILAGDALQNKAFELLAMGPLSDTIKIRCIKALAAASGETGMALGQMWDLERTTPDLNELEEMNLYKTGALIQAAVLMGAFASGVKDTKKIALFSKFGQTFGLGFQIQDDLLDVIGDTQTLGKPQGADRMNHKKTYIDLLGIPGTQQRINALYDEALTQLTVLRLGDSHLAVLIQKLQNRIF